MKKYFKYVLITFLSCIFGIIACTEVQDGYISDRIMYYANPFIVASGVTTYSQAPNLGGSSVPVTFEILDVKDANGTSTDELTKGRRLLMWTSPYNSYTDSTIELIQAKRTWVEGEPTMRILERSGQLLFTESTLECQPGTYSIDMKMSNSAGERIFNDVLKVTLEDRTSASGPANWCITDTKGINPDYWTNNPASFEFKHDPNGPNKIHVRVCDQNGNPFNWKTGEVAKRGSRPCLEFATPWAETIYTDTEAIFEYPFTPFPFGPISSEDGTWSTDYCYYRIKNDYVAIDGYDAQRYYADITFFFYLYRAGEWWVDIKYPTINRVG